MARERMMVEREEPEVLLESVATVDGGSLLRHGRLLGLRWFLACLLFGLIGLVLFLNDPAPSDAVAPLGGADARTLTREPILTPDELGDGTVDGLQYADPTEGLALVAPPTVVSGGDAAISYPLLIPPGRGITPALSLDYSSGAGNSWAGLGWDLSVGSIEVDMGFGAPRFDPAFESESYTIDGELLVPNALGDAGWKPRLDETRQDYTRQVETEYEQIIRHFAGRTDGIPEYYWEVHDKDGNVRWYGGLADGGGPIGDPSPSGIDRSAIVYNDAGYQVKWLLSAERDVGVNLILYSYETIHYKASSGTFGTLWEAKDECVQSEDDLCARHTYLDEIDYTAATADSGHDPDPAYRVHFELESEGGPFTLDRTDSFLDGMGGYLDLTKERLAAVEVKYGPPEDDEVTGTGTRSYDLVAARYELEYVEGPFGKSLLKSITQVADAEGNGPTHTFEYVDAVRDEDGVYHGFEEDSVPWDTGGLPLDIPSIPEWPLTGDVNLGVLGTSLTAAAEGHMYVGFNLAAPTKTGSVGGTVQSKTTITAAGSEWFDINGDSLPDKVYYDVLNVDGDLLTALAFNPNLGGGPEPEFGEPIAIHGLDLLSNELNVNWQVSAEAHMGVTAALGLGADFAISTMYFTDVNGDGLVDFVSPVGVYYNHLVDGVPTFTHNSTEHTPVILPGGDPNDIPLPADVQDELAAVERVLEEQSPLVDTVRRWTAPLSGAVTIDAPATLLPGSVDGVRVAIQHNNFVLAFEEILPGGGSMLAFGQPLSGQASCTGVPDSPTGIRVLRGDAIYFRLGSRENGAGDEVEWSPTIRYECIDDVADVSGLPLDVNGLDQALYSAGDDFTLAGRMNATVEMPRAGTVGFTGVLNKHRVTTDDVRLVLRLNGVDAPPAPIEIPASFTGEWDFSAHSIQLGVAEPLYTYKVPPQGLNPEKLVSMPASDVDAFLADPANEGATFEEAVFDEVEAYIATDTPVDVTALEWVGGAAPQLEYAPPPPPADPEPPLSVGFLPVFELYPGVSGVSTPWTATWGSDGFEVSGMLTKSLNVDGESPAGVAVVSVRTPTGVVAKQELSLPAGTGPVGFAFVSPSELTADTDYWFDITVRDPALGSTVAVDKLQVRPEGSDGSWTDVPVTVHWMEPEGIFPVSYRGWAVAGYKVDDASRHAPIDTTAFEIDPADFATDIPDGQDDAPPSIDEQISPLQAVIYLPVHPPAGGATQPDDQTVLPGQPGPLAPAWQGPRPSLAASAERMRSSRLITDSATLTPTEDGRGRAIPRISVTGPTGAASFGLGPLGGSLGGGPSFGILDFEDMNGDGYPDVITVGNINYTDQRGRFFGLESAPGHSFPNQDLTLSLQLGSSTDLIDIAGNAKGKTNATQGSSAGKGDAADDSTSSVNSASLGFSASFTSPNLTKFLDHDLFDESGPFNGVPGIEALRSAFNGLLALMSWDDDTGLPLQQALVDVNGDGLPDHVINRPLTGTTVRYNLGYSFTGETATLSRGGFEVRESYGGNVSLGFETHDGSYSVGGAISGNMDLARHTWRDVNGDGILDYVWKQGPADAPTVAFGNGSGVMEHVDYGKMSNAVPGLEGFGVGQVTDFGSHAAMDVSVGGSAEFDVTVPIGPLCTAACYIILGAGFGGEVSVSTPMIDLQDVDGDGYPDSLATPLLAADGSVGRLFVRRNLHGATNLLKHVTNPLGGSFSMEYERYGNTYDFPGSVWAMSRLEIDDGRPGDGVDVLASEFEYDDLRFDRLHRQSLGFGRATEYELDTTDPNEEPLRRTEREFLNDSVFEAGLQHSVTTFAGETDVRLRGAEWHWVMRDISGEPSDPLTRSRAPLLERVEETAFDGAGHIGQVSTMSYTYDGLGNVKTERDHRGTPLNSNDDVVAEYRYTDCETSSDLPDPCPYIGVPRPAHVSPLWSPNLCTTWVSLPAEFWITNGRPEGAGRVVYRHRLGEKALCDNASVIQLVEYLEDGTEAVTELAYDAWGTYDRIVYPAGDDGVRYAVWYQYDLDRHSDIAEVREFDLTGQQSADFLALDPSGPPTEYVREGLVSKATFDPLAGRVLTRTDANENVTTYEYDSLARIKSISSPRESDPDPLVTFGYAPTAPGYAYAVARHYDLFNEGDTIDTVTFVDGLGRATQTKRDASRFVAAGAPSQPGRVVSGATNFDVLGRPVEQFYPTWDQKALTEYDDTPASGPYTVTTYDLKDRLTSLSEPGDPLPGRQLPGGPELVERLTTVDYGFASLGDGVPLARTTMTDPRGRQRITYFDVHGQTRAIDDAVGAPPGPVQPPDPGDPPLDLPPSRRTTYDYDRLGQLVRVGFEVLPDPAAAGAAPAPAYEVAEHTYDSLGRRTSTETPDSGLATYRFDREGKLTGKTTPNLGPGEEVTYGYELGRLVAIDYPDGTPDIAYTYGVMGDGNNGAGRPIRAEDGARVVEREFSTAGDVERERVLMKLNGWDHGNADPEKFTWTTEWTYDGLGRVETMVYSDGERLTYDYDLAGLLKSVVGEEDGVRLEQIGVDRKGDPIYGEVPHTWVYEYVVDQQYDEFLYRRFSEFGNGTTTEYTYDPNTLWLARKQTQSPNRNVKNATYFEIQDLNYTYDVVGNPLSYENELPEAKSNLFGGPARQEYTYDAFERVVGATGSWDQTKRHARHYAFELVYDDFGNVTEKRQRDFIQKGNNEIEQRGTTYSFTRTFDEDAPHQVAMAGDDTFEYDASGNLTGIVDDRGKYVRELEWDAMDRLRSVSVGGSTTAYRYDDTGQRAIERGPQGETAFVNPWVTVRNGNEIYKHVWAGATRIATQRDDGNEEELKRYFLHTDLQGSTNVVTDAFGDTFQHHEYFPTGEVWVDESSTVFRTPYQYGGSYVDEVRSILNFGARWYDPQREIFYAPDPILVGDPLAVVADPELRSAYSFGGANPLTFVDPTGLQRERAQPKRWTDGDVEKGLDFLRQRPSVSGAIAENLNDVAPDMLVRYHRRFRRLEGLHNIVDFLSTKPLLAVNRQTGQWQLSPGMFVQFTIRKGRADMPISDDEFDTFGGLGPNDATGPGGRPDEGGGTSRWRAGDVSESGDRLSTPIGGHRGGDDADLSAGSWASGQKPTGQQRSNVVIGDRRSDE